VRPANERVPFFVCRVFRIFNDQPFPFRKERTLNGQALYTARARNTEAICYCNVWGSVKANRPSVNKYANLTRHSSSLLDLDSDIGCP
jgi:hypothetical protein